MADAPLTAQQIADGLTASDAGVTWTAPDDKHIVSFYTPEQVKNLKDIVAQKDKFPAAHQRSVDFYTDDFITNMMNDTQNRIQYDISTDYWVTNAPKFINEYKEDGPVSKLVLAGDFDAAETKAISLNKADALVKSLSGDNVTWAVDPKDSLVKVQLTDEQAKNLETLRKANFPEDGTTAAKYPDLQKKMYSDMGITHNTQTNQLVLDPKTIDADKLTAYMSTDAKAIRAKILEGDFDGAEALAKKPAYNPPEAPKLEAIDTTVPALKVPKPRDFTRVSTQSTLDSEFNASSRQKGSKITEDTVQAANVDMLNSLSASGVVPTREKPIKEVTKDDIQAAENNATHAEIARMMGASKIEFSGGKLTPDDVKAIKVIQKKAGLKNVTGVLDKDTLHIIEKANAGQSVAELAKNYMVFAEQHGIKPAAMQSEAAIAPAATPGKTIEQIIQENASKNAGM